MNRFLSVCETCVSAGIRAYIELLAFGELRRSRLLLNDVLTLSTAISGGPSARVGRLPDGIRRAVAESTARSLLATLLVLRTTGYWTRVPALETLLTSAARLGTLAGHPLPACTQTCSGSHGESDDAEPPCGCRRSRTLPGGPVVYDVVGPEVAHSAS